MTDRLLLSDEEKERIENKFRVPVDRVPSRSDWVVSLDRQSETPTDSECAQIRSYIEFVVTNLYREDVARAILAHPLAQIASHNTLTVCKGFVPLARGGWQYRRASWRGGPLYSPDCTAPDYRPLSLVEVLDLSRRLGNVEPDAHWTAWKRGLPNIFPPHQ